MASDREIVLGIYEAFGTGDVPAVLAALDPKVDWREGEGGPLSDRNPYIGPQAVAEGVFQRIVERIADFRVNVASVIDGGDSVAVEGRYTGVVKNSGMALDAQFVHVWQLNDGKVVRFQQYTDTDQWVRAFTS